MSKANKLKSQKRPNVKNYVHGIVMIKVALIFQTKLSNSNVIHVPECILHRIRLMPVPRKLTNMIP